MKGKTAAGPNCHTYSSECGEELDADLATIMDMESNVCRKFAVGSFQHLFWNQQMEASLATPPQQSRWCPLCIKRCLNVHMLSSAAFHIYAHQACFFYNQSEPCVIMP